MKTISKILKVWMSIKLRSDKNTTTAIQQSIAPLQAQLNTLSAAVLYNAKPYTPTATTQQSGQ